jgi:hypothetical protein
MDEAEFVDPVSYRSHYESTARRIFERLKRVGETGEFQTTCKKHTPGRSWE